MFCEPKTYAAMRAELVNLIETLDAAESDNKTVLFIGAIVVDADEESLNIEQVFGQSGPCVERERDDTLEKYDVKTLASMWKAAIHGVNGGSFRRFLLDEET